MVVIFPVLRLHAHVSCQNITVFALRRYGKLRRRSLINSYEQQEEGPPQRKQTRNYPVRTTLLVPSCDSYWGTNYLNLV